MDKAQGSKLRIGEVVHYVFPNVVRRCTVLATGLIEVSCYSLEPWGPNSQKMWNRRLAKFRWACGLKVGDVVGLEFSKAPHSIAAVDTTSSSDTTVAFHSTEGGVAWFPSDAVWKWTQKDQQRWETFSNSPV